MIDRTFFALTKEAMNRYWGENFEPEKMTRLGAITGWKKKKNVVDISCENALLRITVLSNDVIKVHLAPEGKVREAHSIAVVNEGSSFSDFALNDEGDHLGIITSELIVRVNKNPALVSFHDRNGEVISTEMETMKWSRAKEGHTTVCARAMPLDEHYYGLGEKTGFIDHRRSFSTMWNTDAYDYGKNTDPLYQSIPFFIGLKNSKAYGIFFDNTYRSFFDFGCAREDRYLFGSTGGEFRYYFFYGPEIKKVIEKYTDLTGKPFMPPMWALGHQISRYSYYPQDRVIEIAKKLREHRIPCDAIYLDIDHNEACMPFTWSREDFPEPEILAKELGYMGFELVPIVDPALKADEDYEVYREARDEGYLLKRRNRVYHDRMWPGLCAWPDFTRSEVREWWGKKYKIYIELGIKGIWNDMNEPSVFNEEKTMSDNLRFGDGSSHLKNHNTYALLEVEATYEGLKNLGIEEPFILSRAGFAGIQRCAALWTGDNTANWEHLALEIPMFVNMGLSGLSFVGSDIGGFIGTPSPELLVRWYEANTLVPFFRNHTGKGNYDREPWAYGRYYEGIIKKHIEMRYELIPYLYSLAYESHKKGYPILRPLFFEFQEDEETYTIDDEFMVGPSILVAPVFRDGARERDIYLPEGIWYDYYDKKVYNGGRRITYEVPLDKLPLFVRAGAIIPKQRAVQSTKEKSELRIETYGKKRSTFMLYWDDRATEIRWNGEKAMGAGESEIMTYI